jgi:hypothetical protein
LIPTSLGPGILKAGFAPAFLLNTAPLAASARPFKSAGNCTADSIITLIFTANHLQINDLISRRVLPYGTRAGHHADFFGLTDPAPDA